MANTSKFDEISPEALVEEFTSSKKFENPVTLSFPINIRETEHKYELEMPAPGFKKSDFNITSEGKLLTIMAENGHEKTRKDDHYTRKEYFRSSISRAFRLPDNVLVNHLSAGYHQGILTIILKKTNRFLIGKKHVKID